MRKMEEIDLQVSGRHAMLFDDDAMAEFVNSQESLIQWNLSSLFIDRFDVRNLINNPPPSFRKLPPSFYAGSSPIPPDPHLESQLDFDRYADLLTSPDDQHPESETELATKDTGGYHFVPFSYSNAADSNQKISDMYQDASAFNPPFPVPENLLQNLPPSEKVHQIIARTAIFVSEHGGQSEIVLRVKQGDNPAFEFLMPHHHLHPYFRYLVDHPGVLKADVHSTPVEEKTHDSQASEALSLLGSVYGEDEDVAGEVDRELTPTDPREISTAPDMPMSSQPEQTIASGTQSHIKKTESKLTETMKAKIAALRNAINNNKPVQSSDIKKEGNVITSAASGINQPKISSFFTINQPSASSLFPVNQPKGSSIFPVGEADTLRVNPPSEVKRLVDRMVEIILKNGKNFEAVLIEQDKNHGKFPFLLPSNQYHPYYLKVLKKAQESRTSGKSYSSEKDGSAWQEIEKNASPSATENESVSLGSGSDDLPLDDDKKEKFKMIIAKAKKDTQDQPSKESLQGGFTVDTAAAAAILQAATRGIRKPNLDIFHKTSNGSGSVGGHALGTGSLQSQLQNSAPKEKGGHDPTFPGGNEIAKTASHATISEADSAEAGLTRELKLKAERLRRAKMFAAKIKSGGAPLGTESICAVSAEPPVSGNSGSVPEAVNEVVKHGSSAQKLKSEQKSSDDENEQKSRKKRHYRSRRHEDSESGEADVGSRDENEDYNEKRSRKRHKSHHSSRHHRDRSKDSHKHRKRRSSSKRKESRHRHKHESSVFADEDDDPHHHHHEHDSSSEDEHKHHKQRQRFDLSSEDENRHHKHRHRHRHDGSSEDERKHHKRRHKHSDKGKEKHSKRSHVEEAELEEGEIQTKSSDQSPTLLENASREASVDISESSHQDKRTTSLPPSSVTEVPDELRAKIRAMLLATM